MLGGIFESNKSKRKRLAREAAEEARNKEKRTEEALLGNLAPYYPDSRNNFKHPELTYSAAKNFPRQLEELAAEFGNLPEISTVQMSDVAAQADSVTRLGELLDQYGSDKNRKHNYTPVYTKILDEIGQRAEPAILEVGMGTNDPDIVSSMGVNGHPGASLRAFSNYLPNALVYGADIDRKILFEEARIKTAYVDQLSLTSFADMARSLNQEAFDLIVDDGLHSTEANINTLIFALRSVKNDGIIIIEDIPERSISVWNLIGPILKNAGCTCTLVKANSAYMFLARKGDAREAI